MAMPYVGVEHCGDGHDRAKGGAFFPLNTSTDTVVTAKTASYTVLAKDAFKAFSNSGASGSVTFTLPTPSASTALGVPFWFFKLTAQNVVIAVPAGVTLDGASTLTNSAAEAGAACLCVVAISATAYMATVVKGTWASA